MKIQNLIFTMNLILSKRNKSLMLLFSIITINSYGQDCAIDCDSNKFTYNILDELIKNDSLHKNIVENQFLIIYYKVDYGKKDVYIFYSDYFDSTIFYNKSYNQVRINNLCKQNFTFLNNLDTSLSKTYFLLNNATYEYSFDYLFVKKDDQILQIIPTGCAIFNNLECINDYNEDLHFIIDNISKLIK